MKSTFSAVGLVIGLSAAAPALASQYTAQPAAPVRVPAPATTTTGPTAAPAVERKLNISNEARKALLELQTAVNANDVANIPAKIAAAQAVAKTADDKYFIARIQLKQAVASQDQAAIATAVDAVLASGGVEPSQVPLLHLMRGKVHYNAKQYDQAIASFQKTLAADPSNTEALTLMAEAQKATGRGGDALGALQGQIKASTAAGRKPAEDVYKRALALAFEAKSPAALDISRQWVTDYPSATSWSDALRIYRRVARPDEQTLLDTLRLARATGALSGDADFHIYAYTAVDTGAAGEAKSVIEEATAAGKVDASKSLFKEINTALKTKATPVDRSSLPERARSALADPSAKVAVRVGDVHYGYGEYARAADLYRAALRKNGADADLINLHLGMALARAGDKAGAIAALQQVKGSRAELAKYWQIYASSRP
jgi:tetratricopeptide (TPR) repeat protein